jgi:hypothetical protein
MFSCNHCKYTTEIRKDIREHIQEKHKQSFEKSNRKSKHYSKGSVGGIAVGVIVLFMCFFLVTMTHQIFTDLSTDSLDMLNMAIIFVGFCGIFLGIMKR